MNTKLVEKSDSRALIELSILKDDYQGAVTKRLAELRRTVKMPGFRQGHVPKEMIQRMYAASAKTQEVEEQVSQALYDFIKGEELRTIGQAMPEKGHTVDIVAEEDMTFRFEVALIPPITDMPTKEDHLPYYKVEVSEEEVSEALTNALKQAGQNVEVDAIEEGDLVRGLLTELSGDLPLEGGLRREGAILMPRYMKSEAERAKFVGMSKNSVVVFSPFRAYEGNESELTSFLGVEKERLSQWNDESEFSFEIQSISRHEDAVMGPEFYDKVFGPDTVSDEAQARARVREMMESRTLADSDYKMMLDFRAFVSEHKAPAITLAEDTIRYWFATTEQASKMSAETFDEEFARLIADLKVDLYVSAFASAQGLEVSEEEVQQAARETAMAIFRQYGMDSLPEEVLEQYAQRELDSPQKRARLADRVLDTKIAKALKEIVTLDEKKVTTEAFAALFEA